MEPQVFNFTLSPAGALGPDAENGGDGIGGGGTIAVLGKWDSDITPESENPGLQLALRCTSYPAGMPLGVMTPRWLQWSGAPDILSTSWDSPALDPTTGSDLPDGWEWGVRAPVDIWAPWGFLPDNPNATCEFEVDLLIEGNVRETLPLKGVATFAHPFKDLCGSDLPHCVCPGMSAVLSGGCNLPVDFHQGNWPHTVGMRLGIPSAHQNCLSFSPTGSQPSVDVGFPADKSTWPNPGMGVFRQAIHVTGPGDIALGRWASCVITAQGTLPDQPLWGPTDVGDPRVFPALPIVVFNAPNALLDGTPNPWAVQDSTGFQSFVGNLTTAFRLEVPGFRQLTLTPAQTTDVAAGLGWCLYNGANDTQDGANSLPGDGDEQAYRRWVSASDAAPVTTIVKPGVYLLLVGVTDSTQSANPTQAFNGTVAITMAEAPAPTPFDGTSATGTITSSTKSTANHSWGQGIQYQWNPTADLACDLSLSAGFATRLILTDANGTVLGSSGGSASTPANVKGVQLLKGGTYFIEAGRAWNVSEADLGTGAFTLSNT